MSPILQVSSLNLTVFYVMGFTCVVKEFNLYWLLVAGIFANGLEKPCLCDSQWFFSNNLQKEDSA